MKIKDLEKATSLISDRNELIEKADDVALYGIKTISSKDYIFYDWTLNFDKIKEVVIEDIKRQILKKEKELEELGVTK